MGLDMYLNRFPRIGSLNAEQICTAEQFFDWQEARTKGDCDCSFKKWTGCDLDDVPSEEYLQKLKPFYKKTPYGFSQINEGVAYWRKANAIHNWFVEHIQGGEDDCAYHKEVSEYAVRELLDTCEKVVTQAVMIQGTVQNGFVFKDGAWAAVEEPGLVVINPEVCERLLPTHGGFFFGGTDYDQYYIKTVKDTISQLRVVLETTDFETQMLYYRSSW